MDSVSLGEGIRRFRAAAGLSQKEMAARLDVDPSYVSRLERNEREPSIKLLRRIAQELAVPPGVLLALALYSDMPQDQQNRYRDVVGSMINLTALTQLRMPFEEADEGTS